MRQLAARAAPSYVCDCRRPSALGNMIKSLQIQFCIPCDIPPASVALYTKSPTIFTDSRGQTTKQTEKETHTEAAPDTLLPNLQIRMYSLRKTKYFSASVRLVDSLGSL